MDEQHVIQQNVKATDLT